MNIYDKYPNIPPAILDDVVNGELFEVLDKINKGQLPISGISGAGTSGYSGASGATGASGVSGAGGASGISGYSGSDAVVVGASGTIYGGSGETLTVLNGLITNIA